MNYPAIIHLDFKLFGLAIAAALLLYVVTWTFVFRSSDNGGKKGNDKWFVPSIDFDGSQTSLFHQWDVRVKIVSLLLYCLIVSLISRPTFAFGAVVLSFAAVYLAKIPFSRVLRRITAMSAFLMMFVVILPFTTAHQTGDQLIRVVPFPFDINLRGFKLAFALVCKAAAIAVIMEPLFCTAPLSKTLLGLQRLGVPAVMCQMVLMAHRYIFVFLHEAKRINTGMRVRGFRKKSDMETMRACGNFVGMLLVRSIDRTERVYQAMLARGYNGTFPTRFKFQANGRDWLLGVSWPAIALLLLLFDRYGHF